MCELSKSPKTRVDGKARLSSCVNWARARKQELMAKPDGVHVWIEQEPENKSWWQSQIEFMCELSMSSKTRDNGKARWEFKCELSKSSKTRDNGKARWEFKCELSKRSKRVGKKLQLQKSNSHMTLMHALKYGSYKWPKLGTHKSKISVKYPFSIITILLLLTPPSPLNQKNSTKWLTHVFPVSFCWTIALDPTFGSFTSLKPVSH